MFWDAQNGRIQIDGWEADYIVFGKGQQNLIILPGLGDGIKTAKGMAVPFAYLYKCFAEKYRIYVFSRKIQLPESYSTREMARDVHRITEKLGIEKAHVLGVSMGGMIAQYLAIDYPELVQKLILTVTLSQQNDTVQSVIRNWISMAERDDYAGIMADTAEKSYTDGYLQKNHMMIQLSTKLGKPRSFRRFITLAHACISHDAYGELEAIECPTLVIGGKLDKIVTVEASEVLADKIKGSRLYLYEDYGHALYEEAGDFNERVMDFLAKS